jgi:predicted nuclease of predicted toxin-antitoxin system
MKFLFPDILADENISLSIIIALKTKGFKVLSVAENYKGYEDSEIIKLADDKNAIILTEDRDFGEWIFSHRIKCSGVIYLRYEYKDRNKIIKMLIAVLEKYCFELYEKFTVITPEKIRIREF